MHRSGLTGSVSLLLATFGCDDEPGVALPDEIIGETQDLRIYRDESAKPICKGTFDTWQAHVDRIGAFMGTSQPLGPIDVVLTARTGIESYCGDLFEGISGCAILSRRPPVAVGSLGAIPHELAHAVDAILHGGSKIPFWSEGFAEAWSERGSALPREPALDAILTGDAQELPYPTTSHWVQWIAGEYGVGSVAEILQLSERTDTSEDRLAQFERVFGEPYPALQERFWREAPLYAPGFARCGETDFIVPSEGRVDFSIDLHCDKDPAPSVNGPGGGLYTTRVLEVVERGRYELVARPGYTMLTACDATDDPFEAERRSSEPNGSSPSTGISAPQGIEAGRYKLWIVAPTVEPAKIEVTILPAVALTRIAE